MALIGIAGGGIGGLTLAVSLQQQGLEVLVLERQPEVRDRGAGISLWPNALAALDVVNLGHMVRSIGKALASGGERKLNGGVAFRFSRQGFVAALGEGLVCVDRGELVRALAARLTPGTLRTSCPVTGYTRTSPGVTVRVHKQDDVHVDALVGADGISSAVAGQLGGPLKFSYSGYAAWRAIADMESEPDSSQLWACFADGHEFGWLPIGKGRTYWFATACLPERDCGSRQDDENYLKDMFRDWPPPIPDLLMTTLCDQLVRTDIVDRTVPRPWSDGPVTLLGDAAHPMRPHLGQGGCQAIEDAVVLTSCLAEAGDLGDAFGRYERRRRRRASSVVRLSRHSGLTRPTGRLTTVFDFATSALPQLPIGPAMRAIAPICAYRAGQRAVQGG
jgi:2-polyprenyl-6-methoxyphenol hydroxylase-like FAD-dependent oxidoreductase